MHICIYIICVLYMYIYNMRIDIIYIDRSIGVPISGIAHTVGKRTHSTREHILKENTLYRVPISGIAHSR